MASGAGPASPSSIEGGLLEHTDAGLDLLNDPKPAEAQPRLVAVVCKDEIARRRLAAILLRAGYSVVGSSSSPRDLDFDSAAVVVMVLEGCSSDAVGALRARLPNARIVATGSEPLIREIRSALARGADGYILDDQIEEALVPSIRAVCSGYVVVPRELRSQIARPILTAREKQVLGMVAMGFTNAEIAAKLHLVESTVKSHLSSIFGKLGVRSRSEAAEVVLDPEHGFGTGILAITGRAEEAP